MKQWPVVKQWFEALKKSGPFIEAKTYVSIVGHWLYRQLISRVFVFHIIQALVALLVLGTFVWFGATTLENAIRNNNNMRYMSDQLDPVGELKNIINWDYDYKTVGRQFTLTDGNILGTAITDGWRSLLLATRSNNVAFLNDNFSGTALNQARAVVAANAVGNDRGKVVMYQSFKPRFFHVDGSIVELKSDDALTVRYELDEEADKIVFLSINRECMRLVMFLETVGWKIRNHEIDCLQSLDEMRQLRKPKPVKLPIRGMNYYPANSPWLEFWTNFDERVISADMARMYEMGVDTIRIFLPYEYFMAPATQEVAIRQFEWLLKVARSENIDVIPTLFDFRNSYDPIEWAQEYAYMRTVAGIIRKYDNVAMIDLKNEPDLDYKFHGKAKVDLWLITFSRLLQNLLPEMPVTIGWLEHTQAVRMAEIVDVVSYHEYGDPEQSGDVYNKTKAASGGKAVIISEIGQPSWSLFGNYPYSPRSQADWLAQQFENLKTADGLMVWTLHDFSYESVGKVASLPWRRAMQARYGIIDRQGMEKPAVSVFRKHALGNVAAVRTHEGHRHLVGGEVIEDRDRLEQQISGVGKTGNVQKVIEVIKDASN